MLDILIFIIYFSFFLSPYFIKSFSQINMGGGGHRITGGTGKAL
jgi:hypothetical protein